MIAALLELGADLRAKDARGRSGEHCCQTHTDKRTSGFIVDWNKVTETFRSDTIKRERPYVCLDTVTLDSGIHLHCICQCVILNGGVGLAKVMIDSHTPL